MSEISDEERSKYDAAVSNYIGKVEAEISKLRTYVGTSWNKEPDKWELTHQVFVCRTELEMAFSKFDLEAP